MLLESGFVLLKLGHASAALADCDKALAANPDSAKTYKVAAKALPTRPRRVATARGGDGAAPSAASRPASDWHAASRRLVSGAGAQAPARATTSHTSLDWCMSVAAAAGRRVVFAF